MTQFLTFETITGALHSPERTICLTAAEALGKLFACSDDVPMITPPSWSEAFSLLFQADKDCHGVADAFWGEVQFDCDEYEAATAWMLDVLKQRGPVCISDISSNDLEFHAHEAFDSNTTVLTELMNLEFDSLVVMALEHGALSDTDDRTIREKAIDTERESLVVEGVLGLFLRHDIIHPIGVDRGMIRQFRHPNGKEVVVINFQIAARGPHWFVYSQGKQGLLSIEEMWQMLDLLVDDNERGSEITRDTATQSALFSIVPNTSSSKAVSKFYERGYVATMIGLEGDKIPFLRIDLPVFKQEKII